MRCTAIIHAKLAPAEDKQGGGADAAEGGAEGTIIFTRYLIFL